MLVLGVTGLLGAGKTTVADMFARAGAAVFSADRAVHDLYAGAAAGPVGEAFPGAVRDGAIDRAALAALVMDDDEALARLEAIVHPLVREAETEFRLEVGQAGRRLVVSEIPLLFETGGERRVDAVVLVTADKATRRARVMERPGMTPERFDALGARQWPEARKRAGSHFVVDNGRGLEAAERQVSDVIRALGAAVAAS